MAIDFGTVITDLDKNPILEGETPVTLKAISIRALVQHYEDEARTLTVSEKFERGQLASRIHGATEPLELKSEDVTRLKALVGKFGTSWIVFSCLSLIDPGEKK